VDLRKHVKLIVKSFWYIGDSTTLSKKLAFYIVKLAAITGFLIKKYYKVTFQSHQVVWDQKFDKINKSIFETIKEAFSKGLWSLKSQKLRPIEEEIVDSESDF